ncbi:MAG: RNA polymerase subunit sigma-24, partial [Armatimonadetes bacterium CG_4_10_14_3_um_filter_66_18]
AKTATRRELAAQVQTALRRLPDNQRLAMVLFRFEGLSQREVAEAMECSVGAVEALLHRAGRNLRRDLQEYVEES